MSSRYIIVAAGILALLQAAAAHALSNQDVVGVYRLKGYTLTYNGKAITEKDIPARGELAFTADRFVKHWKMLSDSSTHTGSYIVVGNTLMVTDDTTSRTWNSTISYSNGVLTISSEALGMQETDYWERVDSGGTDPACEHLPAPHDQCEPCPSFPEINLLTCDNDGDNGFTVADVIFLLQVLAGQRKDIHYPPPGGSFMLDAECVDGSSISISSSAYHGSD